MGTIFATRRDGTRALRPRYMLAPPSVLTEHDRRNIDILCEMYDQAALDEDPPQAPPWARRLQRAMVEDVLRVLSDGGAGKARGAAETFAADLAWVRDDAGTAGFRLSDICLEFGWDHGELRARFLAIAAQAQAGQRRLVPTVARPARTLRLLSVA